MVKKFTLNDDKSIFYEVLSIEGNKNHSFRIFLFLMMKKIIEACSIELNC